MEYLILFLCCLTWSRKPSWHQGADPFRPDTDKVLRSINEYDRRIKARFKNVEDYFYWYEVTGDEDYFRYGVEERKKAEQLIEEFKKEHKL